MDKRLQEVIKSVGSDNFAFSNSASPTHFPEHWHTLAEFILAKKDGCKYSINHKEYELNSGEILLIWPMELHSIISTPSDSSLILQFRDDILIDCKDFNINYHNLRNIHNLNKFSPELNSSIRDQILKIDELTTSGEPFAEPKILIIINQILIDICERIQHNNIPQSSVPGYESPTYYVIKKACGFITDNCTRNLTQTEVSDYCGFSSYYFSRIFKKYTGESFPEYLTKKRIAASTYLLLSDTTSITDIAFKSGFQSISNFNKAFKKIMGYTPMQYRNLYSGEDQ